MVYIFNIKSASEKINGYNFEVDQDNKTFSIGYQVVIGEPWKTTYKNFKLTIQELYRRGYTFVEKRWI